jgi:hypothetical protein
MSAKAAKPIADHAKRYMCADIDVCPIEDDRILVYSRNHRSIHILQSDVVKLLISCKGLKTIDEHAAELYETFYRHATRLDSIKNQLSAFVADGLLISYRSILEKCAESAAPSTDPTRITSVAVPFRNRTCALHRGLISYIENCKQYGRTNDFIVVDDSVDRDTGKVCQEMLKSLRKRYGVEIRYADTEAKRRFAKRLTEYGDIPEDLVTFALFGAERCNLTTAGANRNAILLDTVGEAILSVDDDTVCRIAAAPEYDDTHTFVFGMPATFETWLYAERETLLRSVAFIDTDLLALHEPLLGKSIASYIAASKTPTEMHFTRTEDRYIRQLASGYGRIAVTLNGIVGDCGSNAPGSLFLPDRSFRRLTRTDTDYRTLRLSREIFRFVNNTVITDRFEQMMSTFFGLDNRTLVPPFLPVGRGQDGLFGCVMGRCFDGTYAARLPWSLLHAPVEARSFTPDDFVRGAGGRELAGVIGQLINTFQYGPVRLDGAEKLRRLGRYLEEIGRLSGPEFGELLRTSLWHTTRALIAQVEDRVRRFGESSPGCVEDARIYLAAHRRALTGQETWMPIDLSRGRSPGEAQMIAQHLVLRFGQLLYWWPDIVQSVCELRRQGVRVTQPVA